jgi:hypothetical protein
LFKAHKLLANLGIKFKLANANQNNLEIIWGTYWCSILLTCTLKAVSKLNLFRGKLGQSMRLSRSGRHFLPSVTYFKGFSHVEMFSRK